MLICVIAYLPKTSKANQVGIFISYSAHYALFSFNTFFKFNILDMCLNSNYKFLDNFSDVEKNCGVKKENMKKLCMYLVLK